MAKEKETKPVEESPKLEPKNEEKESLVLPELEFVCRMCMSLQGKLTKSASCVMVNARGVLCSKMQNLQDLIISLSTENELHDKYLKAHNTQPYFTKEEMHELYLNLFNQEKELNFDQFLDYHRAAGYVIV